MNGIPTLGAQAEAISALAGIAKQHPGIPGGYLAFEVYYNASMPRATVQLQSLDALETWREALKVAVSDVVLDGHNDRLYLEFDAVAEQVPFHVYVAFPLEQDQSEGAAA